MTAYKKDSKNSSAKHKSGHSLCGMDKRSLNRIAKIDHKTTASKIRAELNEHLERSISTKSIRWELYKFGFYGRAAIKKPLFTQTNVAKHLKWC